jgi:hypothetical protein
MGYTQNYNDPIGVEYTLQYKNFLNTISKHMSMTLKSYILNLEKRTYPPVASYNTSLQFSSLNTVWAAFLISSAVTL